MNVESRAYTGSLGTVCDKKYFARLLRRYWPDGVGTAGEFEEERPLDRTRSSGILGLVMLWCGNNLENLIYRANGLWPREGGVIRQTAGSMC